MKLVLLRWRAVNAVTIRDLIKNARRMRPDRIIVGECRDGAALDMLQAMNTGHDGSMTTTHANSPRECIARLENPQYDVRHGFTCASHSGTNFEL